MWMMGALPVKVFHCPPFAVVCEGERGNPPTSEVQAVRQLSDTKNVRLSEIHRHVVEVYAKGAVTKKGICGNGASVSKKTEQMCVTNKPSAQTGQVGNFRASCIQS